MKRHWTKFAAAAAVLAVAVLGSWWFQASPDTASSAKIVDRDTTAAPATSAGNVALDSAPTDDPPALERLLLEVPGDAPRIHSLQENVAGAKVIVVATLLDSAPVQPKQPGDVPEVAIRWRVSRILKGDLADEIVTAQKPSPPVAAGVEEFAGREWILFLSPEFLAGKHPYAGLLWIKAEPQVRAILSKAPRARSARALSLEECVDKADLIFRGTIRAIKDSAQGLIFQYNVTKVLHGKLDTNVITISPLANETAEKNNDWLGRDVIVFLWKLIGTDGEPAYLLQRVSVCAPDESLDDEEAQILDIVATKY